jgi:acyl-CoA thioester hydrolase
VPEEFIDANGHMNIGRYLEVASRGLWESTKAAGFDANYISERNVSTFTAEHHLRYLSELRLGDELSVHPRLLQRSDKVFHSITFVVDQTRKVLAATCEAVLIHVDMASRRPAAFPADIAAGLDTLLAAHDVAWPAPVCGAMGVSRR